MHLESAALLVHMSGQPADSCAGHREPRVLSPV